jgi:hypothetical protein
MKKYMGRRTTAFDKKIEFQYTLLAIYSVNR